MGTKGRHLRFTPQYHYIQLQRASGLRYANAADLKQALAECGLPVNKYGVGSAKSVQTLLNEVSWSPFDRKTLFDSRHRSD
jgi:hypothetical protein